ncbi:DUF1592 domain-containing protein [Verrucomicrobiota bacterium sgz303538]
MIPSLAICGWLAGAVAAHATEGAVTLQKDIKPLLQEYCLDCHNPKKQKGDLNLAEYIDNEKLYENREVWEKVFESVEAGDMPPDNKPQPSEDQRQVLLHYVEGQLSKFDCKTERNPGRVTVRRLNRDEYRNTVRDLLRVDYRPEDFPNDEVGYGFDNIGDVLSLSPMLMEKFLAAAEEIAQKAIISDVNRAGKPQRFRGDKFTSGNQQSVSVQEDQTIAFHREGEAFREIDVPKAGEYIIRIRAYGEQAGPEAPKMALRVGGKDVKVFDVTALMDKRASYEVKTRIEGGRQRVALAYLNNYVDQNNPDPKLRGDRNLFVEFLEVEGPTDAPPELPESHRRLITKMPEPGKEHDVAVELLRPFLQRAYRRPPTDEELKRVVGFVDMAIKNRGTFLEGMQVAVQAVLCSPRFLFRWELDNSQMKPGEVRELSDWELASRLSYFLWNSMPDDQLFALAEKGELRKNGNLEKEVVRMMKDWRARQFVSNFAGQWLQIRNIWETYPDPDTFPKWSDDLKGLMKEETERFFEAVMKEDRNVLDLLDADFTFLNEKLAKYYGIDGVEGKDFRRVQLPPNSPRGGILTQGSVLLATSTPTRTSPVIRGKWVLEQILGTPPPAPPPDVPPLKEQKQVSQTASLRKRLEQHMSQADCASCHKRMDPLGFALENFDATGAWRDKDGTFPIDASGKMPNGKSFNGAKELKAVLKSGKGFVHTLSEKMMTFALGRGLEYYDRCAVDAIVENIAPQGNRFSALITGIVTSEPFLKRRLDGESLVKNE